MVPYFSGLKFHSHGFCAHCHQVPTEWMTPYYCLAFVAAGTMQYKFEGKRFVGLHAPTAWWFRPKSKILFGVEKGKSWAHYYVTFSGPRAARIFGQGLIPLTRVPHMAVPRPEAFCMQFDHLIDLLNNQPQQSALIAHSLEGLWLELHQPSALKENTDSPLCKIRNLIQDVQASPERPWNMAEESFRLHLSEVHFRHLFRKQCGMPPHQWILHCRMQLASRLLRDGHLPIKDLAERVGFSDLYHFTKMFRQHFDLPPAAYRKEIQGQLLHI